jgi:formylglycine-generating enzyme required for sulfatase activity
MVKIFISYRRADSEIEATTIYEELARELGTDCVIADVHNFRDGVDFRKEIASGIVKADIVLVLIGKDWISAKDDGGNIRLHSADDFVRFEIELALLLSKTLIPILLGNTKMPSKDDFPENIRELSFKGASRLRFTEDFRSDMNKLIAKFKERDASSEDSAPVPVPPVPSPPCPPESLFWKLLIAAVSLIMGIVICFAYFRFFWHEPVPVVSETLDQALKRAQNFSGTTNEAWQHFVYSFDDGIEMVLVPVGCFQMGGDDEAGYWNTVDSWEKGIADGGYICFDRPFWIDKTEVTQAEFARLGGQQAQASAFSGDNLPVEQITWFEANAFCEARGGRLPSEAEWEYAARGIESLNYPWGKDFDEERSNFCDVNCSETWKNTGMNDQYAFTSPVGIYSSGVSWVGALDMAGNVWEWTSSIYRDYPYNANDGREAETGERTDLRRVLRGGSWYFYSEYLRSASRDNNLPNTNSSNNGFRCVRSIAPSSISDLSNYISVGLVNDDTEGSDFEWVSDISEQSEPSLVQTEVNNVRGTFVFYPVELQSVLNEDDYSVGTLEGRVERELRDSERENFHALVASIYIESDVQKEIYVNPYIASDAIRTIQLGFGNIINTNEWTLITWRDVVDSTQYDDDFIAELEIFYGEYGIADLGFIRLAHILNLDLQDGTNFGFRFRLISDAEVTQKDMVQANIYISSVTFLP